jgi:SOS-response transcriptional repressor LexA
LTTTEHSRSIVGYNAAIATGCYIPVLSIGDAMTIKIEEGKALVLSPVEHALSDRHLDGDEIAIRIPDDSMAPDFPIGALAIIKIGSDLEPGNIAFLKVTHQDGRELGEMRRYKLRGFDDNGKIEEFEAINDAYPSYRQRSDGQPHIEIQGRVVEVNIKVKC